MAKNLLDLANRLEKKANAIDEAASKTAVNTTLAIVGDLAYRTPVDTSQALSGWQVTLEEPATGRIGPHYPGVQGSSYRASAAQTINNAKAVLKNKKPGQAVYITNNEPYIRRLNDGYSGQAPAGFVERSVLIGRKMFLKFKIEE